MISTDLVSVSRAVFYVEKFGQVLLERSWAEEKSTLQKEARRENINQSSFNHTSVEHGGIFHNQNGVPFQIMYASIQ